MSATSTNTITPQVVQVLADYELHHSGTSDTEPRSNDLHSGARSLESSSNPPGWPTNHRGIPPYRPVNRNLDREQRPDGTNPIETLFIFTMLNGVRMNATASTVWKATGGRINDRIFRYKIGGEW